MVSWDEQRKPKPQSCGVRQYVGHGYVIPCANLKPCPIHDKRPLRKAA